MYADDVALVEDSGRAAGYVGCVRKVEDEI